MALYKEIGYYRAIIEAESAAKCALQIKRLVENVLRRKKLPIDVRTRFIEDAYQLFDELWGVPLPEWLASSLSSYYMQEDTSGAIGGDGKYAPCSNYEYSFFSYKKERRIAQEDYFKESQYSPVIENSSEYSYIESESDYDVWIEELISRSNFREDEDYLFRKSVLGGVTLRELEGYKGMSKSTLGRRLLLARNKFKKAVTKYGGRG